MPNLPVKDATGANVFLKASGTGTNTDPYLPEQFVDTGTIQTAIQNANNLASVSTLLGQIKDHVDTLEALINFTKNSGATDANTIRTVTASNDPLIAPIGTTDDAASITGSINAKLRQLILDTQALKVSGYSIYRNIGSTATANIKTGSTELYSLSCTNLGSSIAYLLLFDSTGATTTVANSFPVYPDGGFTIIENGYFLNTVFITGLTFGFSTTPTSYTAGAAENCILEVRYK